MNAALQLDSFSFAYPESAGEALSDVSLSVGPGEFVLVCGDSGSGKSTLLRAACGLVPHHFGGSVRGEAATCGMNLREHHAGSIAAVCGTVFQDPEVQVVMGRVRHEIAFPLENAGWEPGAIAVAVEETALVLGIHHLLDRRTSELSGGELQRVVLASALAPRPRLLVLDEPTSQLDPVAADELIGALALLNGEWGTAVLLADHRTERCLGHADRVIAMEAGAVAFDGAPDAFLTWAADGRPQLLTPLARAFDLAGVRPLPVSAKSARAIAGPNLGPTPGAPREPTGLDRRFAARRAPSPARTGTPVREPMAVAAEKLRFSYGSTVPALDGVSLVAGAGERVALMGANGSGKSTLLRLLRGLERPDSGRVTASGAVGLLLQNPNDYLIHERVEDEAPAAALERFGLGGLTGRDPRDLSGGERQRLALAIVMQDEPAALLLDEPTRGMDRVRKAELAAIVNELATGGTAIVIATHDAEFAAAFADRVVLLGSGRVLADDTAVNVLGGGWHYATDIAKLLPGTGAITPEQGARLLAGAIMGARPAGTAELRIAGDER